MFEYSARYGHANTITDLPTGDYVVVNLLFKNEKTEEIINIFAYKNIKSPVDREIVCYNFLFHKDKKVMFKEAVLIGGVWRNEHGQLSTNVAEFLPDNFLDFIPTMEEERERFTLTNKYQVINKSLIN